MVRGCLVLLVLAGVIIGVHSQPDSLGFISIDCGLPAQSSIVDNQTKLTYVSDEQFVDTGVNSQIHPEYALDNLRKQLLTVRSFPNGTRNCYTLRFLTIGSNYLVRAIFMYGNYDNLNKPPVFDIHLGVNYWDTFNKTPAYDYHYTEIIVRTTADYLQACLINKNQGTPFISWLELRPLKNTYDQYADSTNSLVFFQRLNLGGSNYPKLRYHNDLYDRIWANVTLETWTEISTNFPVEPDTDFATPTLVMQTAATTLSTNQSLDYYWTSDNSSIEFLVILHVGEIEDIPSTAHREFDIFSNGKLVEAFNSTVPAKLYSGWASYVTTGRNEYNVSLKATTNSTLPPLLNALEIYVNRPVTGVPTSSGDVTTINTIKANYKVNKGWNGDPCVPTELSWTGVTCAADSIHIPRITALNLSASELAGTIISSFGNLSSLESLDLSSNNLSGGLPTFLEQLTALTYLDITGNNNISTTLPPGLQKKQEDGTLTYKFEDFTKPGKKKKIIVVQKAVVGVIGVLLIAVAIILILCLKRNKHNQIKIPKPNECDGSIPLANQHVKPNGAGDRMLNFENRQFTYSELKRITNSFQNNIGTGGFGSVYVGLLENGTQVAVKILSHSSSQGVKEFLAEAQNLTRVHHKNLVSLMGYCMDGDCMALVYEYMQEGTLQDKLGDNGKPLIWKQRLQIGYESAQGLEYLHKACNPPLIHRDVKTNNILLNANLEAKIADFGLSRAFNNASSHVSTAVVGTPGYLDPEYYTLYQLSEKSDVFSFGVVLLEIITGKPPIIAGPDGGHVIDWVSQKLSRGDIENIVDQRMHGQYDINSVWKVTELACRCTDNSSAQRPTMSVVVAELKESLDLETSTEGTRSGSTNPHNYSRNDNFVSDFENANMEGMPAPGPTTR